MINADKLLDLLLNNNIDFFTGVPDSHLQSFNNAIINKFGFDNKNHIVAVNEGNAVALAAGYNLATQKYPCVYLQNSGLGNIINPVTSLLSDDVYAIPCVFVIGWRGEPGVKDEPQHKFQGKVTLEQLELLGIKTLVLDNNSTENDISKFLTEGINLLKEGKQICFLVKKNVFDNIKINFQNDYTLIRESVINKLVDVSKDDIVVSTTGKISRELFEVRENIDKNHDRDFLTVGSMGHSSSIALSIALNKKDHRVWCIDGDGAILMHMGAMALISKEAPNNFIHVVLNNSAHESVGGVPTLCSNIDLYKIAETLGYKSSYLVTNEAELNNVLSILDSSVNLPIFIEIRVSILSRSDLGRPTKTPKENKNNFINFILNK